MAKRSPLGQALRIYRATHNLTQWELGRRIGIDNTKLSMIETGKRPPTAEQLKKLAKLGIVAESTEAVA